MRACAEASAYSRFHGYSCRTVRNSSFLLRGGGLACTSTHTHIRVVFDAALRARVCELEVLWVSTLVLERAKAHIHRAKAEGTQAGRQGEGRHTPQSTQGEGTLSLTD